MASEVPTGLVKQLMKKALYFSSRLVNQQKALFVFYDRRESFFSPFIAIIIVHLRDYTIF